MVCGIYRIYNMINGHMYIGSSKNVQSRINDHFNELRNRRHINAHLQAAYNKYGEVFDIEVLLECHFSELLDYEQEFMDVLKPEYNASKIAGKVEFTSDVISKMSLHHKGQTTWLGRHHSIESRTKMSSTHKGMDNHQSGNHNVVFTVESRRRISESLMGNKYAAGNTNRRGVQLPAEVRHKMSESAKRRKTSEETKHKLSIASKRYWEQRKALPNV